MNEGVRMGIKEVPWDQRTTDEKLWCTTAGYPQNWPRPEGVYCRPGLGMGRP